MERRESSDSWGTSTQRNTIGGRRAAMRVVIDPKKGMVVVYEAGPDDAEPNTRTLIFESQSGNVHLQEFPDDWRRMPDNALLALRQAHS